MEIVNSVFPDQHIIGSAHTAIIVPASDAHYGEHGDYTYCTHYTFAVNKTSEKYALCSNKKEDFLGETTGENLKKGVIRRLMYNPNYPAMTRSLKRFIDTLPASD